MQNPPRQKMNSAVSRLQQDYIRLKKDPLPYVVAEPLPHNMLEWHYVVRGPEDTPFAGGYYHGRLIFPEEFPFRPPTIYMLTPNGRFMTNTRLCLSISDYHPDTWNPAWSVGTILTGLLSFMTEETKTLGSVKSTPNEKKKYAYHSLRFNLQDKTFRDLFPDLCKEILETLDTRKEEGDPESDPIGIKLARLTSRHELQEQGRVLTAWANLLVVVGVAAFAYTVKYVLRQIAYD